MRPRGLGRGPIKAFMRDARYQRYYNRGSRANWEAMKAADANMLRDVGEFLGLTGLVIAGFLIALVAANLGGFHTFVMLILTSPLWGGAALLLKVSE